jgi:LmbE family N-acetylglucosaminyl deacetylase
MHSRPIAELGTVLGVWAHPDDEAYLAAGLMALARRHGQRVVVLTATAGETGTSDPEAWPPRLLGPVRRLELKRSLWRLGVTEVHVADHRDGRCADVPLEEGVALVGRWIAEVRPDTIVTFGPDGMTGHPDHRAVSAWAQRAWEDDGCRARLLHATVTPEFHDRWGSVNDRIGLWGDEPPSTAAEDLALALDLDEELLDLKCAALAEHWTQIGPLVDALGAEDYRRWWAQECFVEVTAPARVEEKVA